MKKILLSILSVLMIFTLGGCNEGNDKTDDIDNIPSNTEIDNNSSQTTSDDEIKLYSDNTKMVFKTGNSQLVYYYSGEKITGYVAYLDYENVATANYALSLVDKDDETIKKAYTNGKYLVVEYAESEYEDTTTSEVRALYSYLEAIQNSGQ